MAKQKQISNSLVPGKPIVLAGETYILPPLTIGQLRHGLRDEITKHDQLINDGKYYEALDIELNVIGAALRRNYPHFSETVLEECLDLANVLPIWRICLGGSGLEQTGEAPAEVKTDE